MADNKDTVSDEKWDLLEKTMKDKLEEKPSEEDSHEFAFYLDDKDIEKLKNEGVIDYGIHPDDGKHYKIYYARRK